MKVGDRALVIRDPNPVVPLAGTSGRVIEVYETTDGDVIGVHVLLDQPLISAGGTIIDTIRFAAHDLCLL